MQHSPNKPFEEGTTKFGVQWRLKDDVIKYWYPPTKKWIIRQSVCQRWGFDPEDGEVDDEERIPEEFWPKLEEFGKVEPRRRQETLPGNETIITTEDLRESSPTREMEQSHISVPREENPRETGTIPKNLSSRTPAPGGPEQSTPRPGIDERFYKELDGTEQWKLWAIGVRAEYAGMEMPDHAITNISPEHHDLWERLGFLKNSQGRELQSILGANAEVVSGTAFGSEFESDDDRDETFEEKLNHVTMIASNSVELYNRAIDLLEEGVQDMKNHKKPSMNPHDIATVPVNLRRYSKTVKNEYYSLAEKWGETLSNDPRSSEEMRKAKIHIHRVYSNQRDILNRWVVRFMRYLAEAAIPHIQYAYRMKLGMHMDEPGSIELNSVLSGAAEFDTSWTPEEESYFEDLYVPSGTGRQDMTRNGYLTSIKEPGPLTLQPELQRTSIIRKPPLKEGPSMVVEEFRRHEGAKGRESGSNPYAVHDLLEKKEEELDQVQDRLSRSRDPMGFPFNRIVREGLEEQEKRLKADIRDLEDDLRGGNRSERHQGSKGDFRRKDRRVTIDPSACRQEPENLLQSRGHLTNDNRYIRHQEGGNVSSRKRRESRGDFPNIDDVSLNYERIPESAVAPEEIEHDSDGNPYRRKKGWDQLNSSDQDEGWEDHRRRRTQSEQDHQRRETRNYQPNREGTYRRHQSNVRSSSRRRAQGGGGGDSDDSSEEPRRRREGGGPPRRGGRSGGWGGNGGNRRDDRGNDGDRHRDRPRRGGHQGGGGGPPDSPGSSGGDEGRDSGRDSRDGDRDNWNRYDDRDREDDRRRRRRGDQTINLSAQDLLRCIENLTDRGREERAAEKEVLEGFRDMREMKRFYRSLPAPWCVEPKTTGKKHDIFKNIQMTIKTSDYFDGDTEDGSYLDWRSTVINRIHTTALSITDKIQQMGSTIKRGDENLRQIFRVGVYTPEVYKRILKSLEDHYGGKARTYTYLRNQMLRMEKFSLNNLKDLTRTRAKVDKFIEHVGVHQLNDYSPEENRTLLDMFMSNVLTEKQVLKFRRTGVDHAIGGENMYCLQSLAKWLRWEEKLLIWTKMNYNPTLLGISKQKVKDQKRASQKTLLTDGKQATTCTTKDKIPLKSNQAGPKRVTLITSEAQEGVTSDSEESCEDESGHESSSSNGYSELDESGNEENAENVEEGASALVTAEVRLPMCDYCKKGRHKLHACEEFQELHVRERRKLCEKEKRCANCLSPKHKTKKCVSSFRCKHCDKKHHSLLCFKTHGDKPPDKEQR